MKTVCNRILALLLVLTMVLSMAPTMVFASDSATATWTKVELSDIKAEDTVAITMTSGDTTYVLPNVATLGEEGNMYPAAEVATVNENTLETGDAAAYGWNITATEGGYLIKTGESYLFITATNAGVRIGETAAVWTVTETEQGNYLSAVDSNEAVRYLGVYTKVPDWRCYKPNASTGAPGTNIKDQNIGFWVLNTSEVPVDPTEAPTEEPTEAPTEAPTEEPTEAPTEAPVAGGHFTSSLETGDKVVIYNPGHSMALSNVIKNAEKAYDLEGTEVVLSGDDTLSGYDESHIWTVTANDDDTYTFSTDDGQTLSIVTWSHVGLAAEENNTFTLLPIDGTDDQFYVRGYNGQYLEWYEGGQYWSVYYNPSEELYAIRFYVVGDGPVVPSNKVSAPKASVKSSEVDSGTEVTLSCTTEGASILYKVGDGEYTEYTAPIVITEDMSITIKAVKDGMEDSKEVSYSYTVYIPPVLGELQATLVTDASTLLPGDRILVVTSGNLNFAMGTNQKANNRGPADVIKAYDKVSYDEYAQIITLESGVVDGTFALYATNGDCPGYLYASEESGNLLRTQDSKDTNASFTITIDESGNAAITSLIEKTSNTIRYNTQGIFSCYGAKGQKPVSIYKLDDNMVRLGLPADGDKVVIYNLFTKGVLSGMTGDLSDVYGCSIHIASAEIDGDKAVCSNGAVIFTVQKNGEYYRFYNESFGYLCSTGTGNNAFYNPEASEDADWLVEEYNGGYKMGSRTANFNGNMQYLQTFAESFTTWGMYNVTDKDVFTYYFYPCTSDMITDGVVNEPQAVFGNLAPAYAGQKYILHFTVDALFGVKELKVYLGETELECKLSGDRYSATIPAELIAGENLTVTIVGSDNKDVAINSSVVIEVKDEPVISDLAPVANSQTKEDKRPVISAVLTNVGENPTIAMTLNGEEVEMVYADGKVTYTPAADLADGRVTVTLTVTRADGKIASKSWSFTVGESNYSLYFGQLHSHNGEYSDGAGTLSGALEYIGSLPEDANVDFVSFTDHSNYFDKSGDANPEEALFDLSLATEYAQERWSTYKNTIAEFNATHTDILALPGFEMTWSGGPGHINTFVTDGIVSRNNTTLNNKTADAGLQLYYSLLATDPTGLSISQFNHPGNTFGNFVDFSYWSAEADERIQLVEVGNGEGQVGGSGYYPSYEQYTLALDKGWHVAPTNNQDNHKGKWGNANDARDVVLAETFTEEGIYDAIRNYRVYSTEDKNLEIIYTVNELPMGTIIENVPETLKFDISVMDPDDTDSIAKVELIVNSGKVAYTWDDAEVLATGILTAELSPAYSYYYVRVTQADGNLAVTAPVWVGESLKLGINSVESSTTAPVTGENVTISTTLSNSEDYDALVKSVVYTTNGSQVLYTDNTNYTINAGSALTLTWDYLPTAAKLTTINVTVVVELDGMEYTFTGSVELDIQDASQLTYIGIDASHSNEYVAGYNKALMGNFSTLATAASIRTEEFATSEALIAACENADGKYSAIVLNVPSRRLSDAKVYSEAELAALAAFNANGGVLIITGAGDSNDQVADAKHMAAAQNELLKALGSSLRLSDDGTYEDTSFGLSFNTYGDNALTDGLTTAVSYYGGSTIYVVDAEGNATTTIPATVSPVLYANAATISKDADADGLGGDATPKYTYAEGDDRLMVMAMEELDGKGMIFVAGSAFMNDYDLAIPATNANNALCENLFKVINPTKVTSIADVRAQTEDGYKFTIEGVVTSNASGYDKDTAFFDCIYVQDETAGINCFPVAGEFKIGDIVRVTGTTEAYQGEPELQVISIEKIGETTPVEPTLITAAQLNDRSVEGMLVTVKGCVTGITVSNGLVESIYVKDSEGNIARVFIDGYITGSTEITGLEVGCLVEATGLASYDDTYAIEHDSYSRIRVRNRAEILCSVCTHDYVDGICTVCGAADPDYVKPGMENPFTDVIEGKWYYDAVMWAVEEDIANGYKDTTLFGTYEECTREQVVTLLWRAAGSPEPTITENPFSDVVEGKYYYKAVLWAVENGITEGYAGYDLFGTGDTCTRGQIATFLYRYAEKPALTGTENPFTDLNQKAFYYTAVLWAVENEITNGYAETTKFCPMDNCSRAQIVTFLYRMFNK